MICVELTVYPKDGVRDPQGDAIAQALRGLDYPDVKVARVGRRMDVHVPAKNDAEALAMVEKMCADLLVNPNIETYDARVKA